MWRCVSYLLAVSAVAAVTAVGAAAQTARSRIDATQSYASLWISSDADPSSSVSAQVTMVAGTIDLVRNDPSASTLEFTLVPGGVGAEMLAPDGTVRTHVTARLMHYTTMTFRSTRARLRSDGDLEFSGELEVTHLTRELAQAAGSSASASPAYTDPVTSHAAHTVSFVLVAPRTELVSARRQKNSELVLGAMIDAGTFPELSPAISDAIWPMVREEEYCEMLGGDTYSKDYYGEMCYGKPLSTPASSQDAQGFRHDFSRFQNSPLPAGRSVGIVLYLKLAPPAPPPSSR